MSLDKNKHLERVLKSHRMRHVQSSMDKYIEKREKVKDALDKRYAGEKVTRAINSGSYAKHTAVNEKFDIDICQPLKYRSFDTLEKMADDVFDFFYNEFEDDDLVRYKTRKQRVSTGLTFVIEGEEISMDVVPGRELSEDDYIKTNRLNLYVRPKGGSAATSTQTNIQKHIDLIKGKGDERKIIRLLKVWKLNKGKKEIKSFFLELITIRAFDDATSIPADLWGKLKMVMEFIMDEVESICLRDPANSNNLVSDTMSASEKKNFSEDMSTILKRVEEDDSNIKIYFPVNDKYDEVDSKGSSPGSAVLGTKSFS